MKERPILFTGPMVRALLDGSKTQTRRVVKPQPDNGWGFDWTYGRITSPHPKRGKFGAFIRRGVGTDFPETDLIVCPHGMPGDRLWVREAWYCDDYRVQQGPYLLPPDQNANDMREDGTLVYCADDPAPYEQEQPVWRPSIHMPRWASRITLEITGVRVERLQDISRSDAIAEGAPPSHPSIDRVSRELGFAMDFSRSWYGQLWEQINGPNSWAANPWVFVIEFKVIEK